MRYLIVFALIALLEVPASAQPDDLTSARELFLAAGADEDWIKPFYKGMGEPTDPVMKGYAAVAEAMMAKVLVNPYSRLSYFSSGTRKLDDAIDQSPDAIELRYLRFTLQSETPVFLGYRNFLYRDKAALIDYLGGTTNDTALEKMIAAYLLSSGLVTENDRAEINKKYSNDKQEG